MKAKRGFTLVEILIVVVILGILAAIVIPQFTEASTEAKLSSLCSDLQTVRSQIELYKVQHNDAVPVPEAGGATWTQMTQYTDVDGKTNATKTAVFKYGPYLPTIPTNPFNQLATVAFTATATATCPADNSTGWWLNTATGQFRANDNYDQDGDETGGDHADL